MESFKAWWAKPFDEDMSAGQWFLFFGLLIVISALWALVLREVTELIRD